MKYIIESNNEANRLKDQNSMDLYNIDKEISHIDFKETDVVLDAGCGAGDVTFSILKRNPSTIYSIDQSKHRIKELSLKANQLNIKNIHPLVHNLESLPFSDNYFDKVVIRFVLHHIPDCTNIIKELRRVLKKDGQLIIIETDGLLYNLSTTNKTLINYLNIIKSKLPLDFHIGRNCKNIIAKEGFKELNSVMLPMHFTGDQRRAESIQYEQRFEQASEVLINILGEFQYYEFKKIYTQEVNNSNNELFYNKFIVTGIK